MLNNDDNNQYTQRSLQLKIQNGKLTKFIKRKRKDFTRSKSEGGSVYGENVPWRETVHGASSLTSEALSTSATGTATGPVSAKVFKPGEIQSHSFMKEQMVKKVLAKYESEYYYEDLKDACQILYKCGSINPWITDQVSCQIMISGCASS